jgi:hypothetical protein
MFGRIFLQELFNEFQVSRNETRELGNRLLLLQGTQAAGYIGTLQVLDTLGDAAFKVTSQWGEDGIIEWLVKALAIDDRTFIEFGVTDYTEANTRFLLQQRNWRGLIFDCDEAAVDLINVDPLRWRHNLTAACAFVTRENVNDLFIKNGFEGRIGILSIDVDGNDYWIWDSVDCVAPAIVICEYNAVFGDIYPITIPYMAEFRRTSAHASNLFWGASIGAFELLARRKGYQLVGTNVEGSNAFFVRMDLFPDIANRIKDLKARPSFFRESRNEAGALSYLSGLDRVGAIADQVVIRVDTGERAKLSELGNLYSAEWLRLMGAAN